MGRSGDEGFSDTSMSLSGEALSRLVPRLRYLAETDSTNRVAAEWASAGAEEWSVVVTDHQTAGRGRLDRTWFAPPGEALLFSVILRPGPGVDPALMSLTAAVALSSVLTGSGHPVDIKWPNDVLIHSKKVAGILSELRSVPSGDAVIVGIGINANVTRFPPELEGTATSLLLESGTPVDRGSLLAGFMASFQTWVAAPAEEMLARYRAVCSTLGRRVRVEMSQGPIEAVASDIDRSGALVLNDGSVVRVGDVIHLR